MTAASTRGIVLRAIPLRESDLMLTLLTAEHGRISAVARGARKSQRRFAGALQLLVLGRFQLSRSRGELFTLESADVEREWTTLASDVVSVAHASYVAEVAGSIVPPEQPEPEALELIVALWQSLAEGGPSPAALRFVELYLLELAGHQPALDACAACGRTELAGGVFDPTRGGAVCRACAATSRGPGVRPLASATLAYLRAIAAASSPSDARAIDGRFDAADRTSGRDALVAMVLELVGKPLKSLEYIAKLARSKL